MPFIYYVKSGGICANDDGRVSDASPRTGTWDASTSNYYDSIYQLLANFGATSNPSEGDLVLVSDVHNKVHTVARVLTNSTGNQVAVISVDDTNQDTYNYHCRGGKFCYFCFHNYSPYIRPSDTRL